MLTKLSQDLVDDPTKGAFLSTFKNKLINGNFDIWQRNNTQTTNGYGSDDRWFNGNTGSTKTSSLQAFVLGQTEVPGNPTFFARTVVASVVGANNGVYKSQRIENVATFSGKKATLSFWAKADSNKSIAVDLSQQFGVGGSPSAPIYAFGVQKFNLTTSWKKYTATFDVPSIFGKVLGTSSDFLELNFWFDAGTGINYRTNNLGQQSGTFDLARVQLEAGDTATDFDERPYPIEWNLCQRFYEVGNYYVLTWGNAASYLQRNIAEFKIVKRAYPSVTLAQTSGTANSPTLIIANSNSILVSIGGASPGLESYGIFYADAEL